jgi:hypothetical protein
MKRIATRVRVAGAAAICLGAVLQAPLTAAASGGMIVAGPYQQSSQGVTITWEGWATLQDIGSGGSIAATLACEAQQTQGVTTGVGVDCWLTANGGVTTPITAKGANQSPSIAGQMVSSPANNATTIPSGNYQLCGFAFYWDAFGAFHTLPGNCAT